MIDKLLGNYLVEKNVISDEQLKAISEERKQVRVKLGLIAVAEKMMTAEQADEVNSLQAVMDKRFGDIAVSKGYLTDEQVAKLLKLQGNPYLSFAQAASDLGILSLEDIEKYLEEYRKAKGFGLTELEALKSGDADRILPLFLPADMDDLMRKLIGVAIRTIIRLVDSEICLDHAKIVNVYEADNLAAQSMNGDRIASLGFGGMGNALLSIAVPFAKEEFNEVDIDALDAVAEFTNCINGLFATSISNETFVDMLPPVFRMCGTEVRAGEILVLPIFINGEKVDLLVTFDNMFEF